MSLETQMVALAEAVGADMAQRPAGTPVEIVTFTDEALFDAATAEAHQILVLTDA